MFFSSSLILSLVQSHGAQTGFFVRESLIRFFRTLTQLIQLLEN